jgi:hypothetical protein
MACLSNHTNRHRHFQSAEPERHAVLPPRLFIPVPFRLGEIGPWFEPS